MPPLERSEMTIELFVKVCEQLAMWPAEWLADGRLIDAFRQIKTQFEGRPLLTPEEYRLLNEVGKSNIVERNGRVMLGRTPLDDQQMFRRWINSGWVEGYDWIEPQGWAIGYRLTTAGRTVLTWAQKNGIEEAHAPTA